MPSEPRVIQVTNVAPVATREQMKNLFNFIGKIDELVLYPETEPSTTSTKVCYVKFVDPEDVGVSLHLTNTVFIDRALIIVPVPDGRIPDEQTALESPNGLGVYPALPASTELSKVDEIRRTVYVANVDAAVTPEALILFFGTHAGEVKYARMAGDEGFAVHAMFIEFTEQVSVMRALGLTGQALGNRAITVVPANTAIVKSSSSGLSTTSSREIEEAMRKVNEAQPLIDAVLDSEGDRVRGSRSRSHRSRSHRSRSRSRGSRSRRRSRSRSHRSRRRSTSRSPRRRSPSPRRRRSKSRSADRKRSSNKSISPSVQKARRDRRDADERGSRSPVRAARDKESRRSNRDESSAKKESSRRKSSRSRSRSPTSRGSRRDRDRNSGTGRERSDRDRERDRNRGKEHGSHRDSREQRGEKKGHGSEEKSRRDRDGERKSSSSKHDRDKESEKKHPKPARDYDEEEQDAPEGGGSDYEQQPEEERDEQSASEDNRSDGDEQAGDSPAEANLSRLDMDVDSE